jgi:hypothetical protein
LTVGNGKVNHLAEFAKDIAPSLFDGRLLKFHKGAYLAGKEEEDIAIGTQLVMAIDSLQHGWVKWDDITNKPKVQRMGLVIEGYRAPPREDLDDVDPKQWPVRGNDVPTDPWQRTVYVVMRDPKANGDDEGVYTLVLSSWGGRRAIQDVCKQAVRHPNENPVISLEADKYTHTKYGLVKTPVLKIVGWLPKEATEAEAA